MSSTSSSVNTIPAPPQGTGLDEARSCIGSFVQMEPITEQSTVTVIVATTLCACLLFLGLLAVAMAYMFLLGWGVYILTDTSDAESDSCESDYNIWTWSMLNEVMGFVITSCGCHEAWRIGRILNDHEEGQTTTINSATKAKYGAVFASSGCFFLWGMIEWFRVSDTCVNKYHEDYHALLLLFRVGVIANGIIMLMTATSYTVHASHMADKEETERDAAGDASEGLIKRGV